MAVSILEDFTVYIYRGDTPIIEFTFTDENGNPMDLTGWTLYFAAKKEDGTVFINKAMTMIDPLQGKAQVSLTSTETDNIGRHVAEVEGRFEDNVQTFAQGLLIILEDVRP